MRRIGDWIGLPVVTILEGSRIGEVSDVMVDEANQICALIVQKDGFLGGMDKLPIDSVRSVGTDAVMIERADDLLPQSPDNQRPTFVCCNKSFIDKEIVTEEGAILGTVADVYISEESDKIVGYEVSDGLLADLVSGRKWISFSETLHVGETIIVTADAKLSDLQSNR
ncbi:PRC-barrel domain-containing protein [Effusibacillus dendaii]|uniref:PRC-barrel domain-containing protein n=1 Tax=Effusibacillus dendaii TaxID=2743772 RepID=A0A7I8DBG0_9BACL|nr:PRC-barrel domain-containing protein [Effusibacillus dendaii]BCJ86299.1 hypothetical protein skT53_12840 [Effusibacillus dendaii]